MNRFAIRTTRRVTVALALTSVLQAACASAPPAPEPPAPRSLVAGGAATRPPISTHRLDNGLEVHLLPDAGAPLVCVQVWVKVGSVDEREARPGQTHGITGLSHFFEHLMFQGTERYPNYDLALAPLGAKNNAFTYQDATVYWAYTPKEHLRTILDIEADRFEKMKVDFIHLEPEREVVKSERRQNVDADPGELAEERVVRNTFDRFPYRWGPIGWMPDLDAITLEEAQRYHLEHYTTDNTALVIAGDFDPAQALAWVNELWGRLPRPARAPDFQRRSEVLAVTESWAGPRHDHLVLPASQTLAFWSFRAPAPSGATARDYAALELIDWALTGGKSGRLTRRLVYSESPMLSNLWARLMPLRFPYAYVWRADLLPGATTTEVEAALDEEIERIATHGLEPDELAEAVASLRADVVRQNLSNSDKAEAIGFSIAGAGSPFAFYERLETYATITSEEIAQAAKRWLAPTARSRVVVVAPTRLSELAQALVSSDPNAAPIESLLGGAVEVFGASLELRDQRAEIDREARAIALLRQRADTASAGASEADRAAIQRYMRDNEMGDVKRAARLAAQDQELRARERELEASRSELLAALRKQLKVARPNLAALPQARLAELLATRLDQQVAVPAPPAAPELALRGAQDLAAQIIVAFALDARGLARSAQDARDAVLALGPKLLATELEPGARALAELALDLARDTDRRNVPIADLPSASLRPTHGGPR